MINSVATVGGVGIIFIMKINISTLQKKYDKAVKDNLYSFTYNGAEILTTYAKYLLEYLKNGANK